MEQLATGFTLIEGPVWDPPRGLLFSDVLDGGVHCLGHDGTVAVVIPHRRGMGGLSLHAAGGMVVSGRNIAYKPPGDGATQVLLQSENSDAGFNDITSDEAGRVYAGSLGASPFEDQVGDRTPGALFLIDLDGTARRVADGIRLTNGMGFSPDGKRLYHSDSGDQTVHVYDVASDGDVRGRRPFAKLEHGLPDGLVVSEDGAVWVADAHGGKVWVFEPDGGLRQKIAVPLPMVTSVCFGGDGLRDLYIVTGSEGAPDHSGTVFRLRVDVPGLPVAPARVRVG